jgi:hypothetical protein
MGLPWKHHKRPSTLCGRMSPIMEEFTSEEQRDGTAEMKLFSAPAVTGPALKRRGGMTALTSLVEEEEEDSEDDYQNDIWDFEDESESSATTSVASDDSFDGTCHHRCF